MNILNLKQTHHWGKEKLAQFQATADLQNENTNELGFINNEILKQNENMQH